MINRFFPVILFLFVTFFVAADSDYSRYTVEKDMFFGVYIEQNGESRDVHDGMVILEKAPFTLVLAIKAPIGILANFSFNDRIYRGFRRGETLDDILFDSDLFMGLAEEDFNSQRRIFIDDIAPHYLFYQNEESHRFDTVIPFGDYFICMRSVDYYAFLSDTETRFPVEQLPGGALYLSLLFNDYDENWERIELQKSALKLEFK